MKKTKRRRKEKLETGRKTTRRRTTKRRRGRKKRKGRVAGADRMSLDLVFTISRGKRKVNEVFEKMNNGLGLSCGAYVAWFVDILLL